MNENIGGGGVPVENMPGSRMNRVIERLATFSRDSGSFVQEGLEKAHDWSKKHLTERQLHQKMQEVDRFREHYRADIGGVTERLRYEYMAVNGQLPQGETTKETLQMHLVGYLFEANRAMFRREKGSMDLYDYAKEQRQIEGVLRALDGQHLHMGTGEGKSSVVIPIASVVEALTSDRRDIVVSSSNWTLVNELKANIERYTKSIDRIGLIKEGFVLEDARRNSPSHEKTEEIRARMEEEVLETGSISAESVDLNRKDHWQMFFEEMEKKTAFDKLQPRSNASKQPRIVFASEKDLVFTYMENKDKFGSLCPTIYMDEADTPFNRGTPYQNVTEKNDLTSEEISEATDDWLLYFMTAQQVHTEDIVADQGSYVLTETAMERLEQIRLEDIRYDIEQDTDTSPWTASLRRGVAVIMAQRGIDKIEAKEFMRTVHNRLKERFLDRTRDDETVALHEYVIAAGDKIVAMMKEEDRAFTSDGAGKIMIRDSYIDELLSEHKYDRETQLAVLAVSSRFEVLGRALAYRSVRFPTFMHAVADKITCFSGTLLYPDPESGKIKKGMLGSFLEEQTRRKIALISPPEAKPVPRPKLYATDKEARQELVKAVAVEEDPVLFIDFNGLKSTKETYELLLAQYGADKVALLPPKPSGDEGEEDQYKKILNDLTRRLACGELRALVSSGAAGIGINIVKPDGMFPDLRVALLGAPASEQQLVQAVGRRRKPLQQGKPPFIWALSTESLESNLSTYHVQKKKHEISLGKGDRSREKMTRHLEKVKDKPEKLFEAVLELIQKKQQMAREDTDFAIAYDSFFERFSDLCTEKLAERIRREVLDVSDKKTLTEKERELLVVYTQEMGLPASLYWNVLSERVMIGNYTGAGINLNSRKAAAEYFQYHMLAGFDLDAGFGTLKEKSPVLEWLDDWYEQSLPSVRSYVDTVYGDYFASGFDARGNKGSMVQVHSYTGDKATLKSALPEGVSVSENELSVFSGPAFADFPDHNLLVIGQGDRFFSLSGAYDGQQIGLRRGGQLFVRVNPFGDIQKKGSPVYFLFAYPFYKR